MTGKEIFMSINEIKEAMAKYEEIEAYLTNEQRLNYLRGFEELIRLYKSNIVLETIADLM